MGCNPQSSIVEYTHERDPVRMNVYAECSNILIMGRASDYYLMI
jgi:hypothetical protein